ncbi:MAG TPA: hypothetical protein VJU87_07125 [Gemmatimonadaceae bacterium]|nr:hypothetical protein [Gemmatimonadaceae bacterium]
MAAGNVVVSDAATGIELPGALRLNNTSTGSTIDFTPTAALPFSTHLRIRLQNLLRLETNTPIEVTVCDVLTAPPPITQLFWSRLPDVTGDRLVGASLFSADSGYVISAAVPVYRRQGNEWVPVFDQPYFYRGEDVSFVSPTHGFTGHYDSRISKGFVLETMTGTAYDTIASSPAFESITRLYMVPGSDGAVQFGVAGGGGGLGARLYKYDVPSDRFASVAFFNPTAQIADIDFTSGDTADGVAVSTGFGLVGSPVAPGRVLVTADGGATWSEVSNAAASQAVAYYGTARQANGNIWVAGGNGTLLHLVPDGSGAYTVNQVSLPGLTNPDTTNYQSLILTDVEFAPGNDQVGWVVGAQIFTQNRISNYRGIIYGTSDGGATWTRQGVQGAPDFGASIPRLNRIDALSATSVWIVGDGGIVLSYKP